MWNPTFFPFQTSSPKWAWFSSNVFELLKLFVQCRLWFEIIPKFEFSLGLSWSLSIQLVSSLGLLFSPVSAIKNSMTDISEKHDGLARAVAVSGFFTLSVVDHRSVHGLLDYSAGGYCLSTSTACWHFTFGNLLTFLFGMTQFHIVNISSLFYILMWHLDLLCLCISNVKLYRLTLCLLFLYCHLKMN